jgi:hypothetical protein
MTLRFKLPTLLGGQLFAYIVTFGAGALQIVAAIFLSRIAFQYLVEGELKLWFVIMAAMPFISLFELGANVMLPHKLAAVSDDPQAITSLMASFVAGVVMVLASVLSLGVLACVMGVMLELIQLSTAFLIIFLGLAATLRVLGNVLQGGLYAVGDNNYDKSIRIGSVIVMFITAASGLVFGLGIYSMPLAWASSAIFSIALSLFRFYKRWQVNLRGFHLHWFEVKVMLASSIRYLAIALPGQMVFNSTPFIIAAKLPAAFSISYGLTQQLVAGIALVVGIPTMLSVPRLASLHNIAKSEAASTLLRTTRNTAVIAACCLAMVGFNHLEILSIWVGRPVNMDSTFIGIYFLVMFVEWQQTTLTSAAMATGNFNFILVTIASAILILLMMPIFIDWFGFVGIPLAIFAAQSLTCHPHNFRLAMRIYNIDFFRYLGSLRSAISVVALLAAANLLLLQVGIFGFLKLAAMTLMSLVIIIGLHFLSRSPESLKMETH